MHAHHVPTQMIPDDRWRALEVWFKRFWKRSMDRGGGAMTVGEIIAGWNKLQKHWKAKSREGVPLIDAIRDSLPEDNDLLDLKMHFAPRTPNKGKGDYYGKGKR